ncbi:arginine-tRNA-protein transferase [Lewinellaceae bacterium SD302]|nr:arginine-tRNA-protein transferase [Lewinellaceae bacterium SD302]
MAYRYVEKSHPFVLSPESLDRYLARGWYRMGSNIFTTHFLCFQQQLFSAIWLRLDLETFRFSKSQRKLMRRNALKFEHQVNYRCFTQEKEILYSRYAADFNGRLSSTLRDNLEDYDQESIYNTYEVNIRDRESRELVAASYFDLGNNSVASILGIYEPGYKAHSLGYYTMLLEIAYCLENGFRYYYPGYVVPGYDRFDYKLRIGPCDFYDLPTSSWRPWIDFSPEIGPVEVQRDALSGLQSSIAEFGKESELCIYPLFEARLYHIWDAEYLPYPYVLLLNGMPRQQEDCFVAIYDPREKEYQLLRLLSLEEMRYLFSESYLASFPKRGFVRSLLQMEEIIYSTPDKATMASVIKNMHI